MAAIDVIAILGLGVSCAGWGMLQRWAARRRQEGADFAEGCGSCRGSCEREEEPQARPEGDVEPLAQPVADLEARPHKATSHRI